jgi:DNA-directed RNA polymerase subunit E'/Rpb7
MKKVIRLTESDLTRLIKKVIKEELANNVDDSCLKNMGFEFQTGKKVGVYNVPSSYRGKYQGSETTFYLDGTMKVKGERYQGKEGKWKCESGQLKVISLSDWKLMPPN